MASLIGGPLPVGRRGCAPRTAGLGVEMAGSMAAERRGNRLLVENYGPGRARVPRCRHRIVEAQPVDYGAVRYVEDQDGIWWVAGWVLDGDDTMRALAWPHDRVARLAGRRRAIKDGTKTRADWSSYGK
ncbi:hypothetical protein [Saccharothrix sp. ST-888]|uniref:hypothetical protein n=1 Tax=Saccharothrix sp. ST-888 TaxID=1427391 RepID=UPI0012E0959E|nr:hypothetical protein [Saccharothrix sp. ST-888]